MKTALLALVGFLILSESAFGQPITTGPLAAIDFGGNPKADLSYVSFSDGWKFECPSGGGDDGMHCQDEENWEIGFYVVPLGDSRLLRASSQRMKFIKGEIITSSRVALTNYTSNFPLPLPPSESYGLELQLYRAHRFWDWGWTYYSPNNHPGQFDGETNILFGVRVKRPVGLHYGWVLLTRPAAEMLTPFVLSDYAMHPLPGVPIAAGEQPMLPPITSQRTSEGLTFTWDTRWGAFVLESTTNLIPPMSWEVINREALSPLSVPTGDAQRLFRLRLP